MEVQEILDKAKAQALKDLQVLLKNQLDLSFDAAAALAIAKLKEAIPGQVDDMVIDVVAPKLIEILKELAAAQIAKVSV